MSLKVFDVLGKEVATTVNEDFRQVFTNINGMHPVYQLVFIITGYLQVIILKLAKQCF